jgi:hypothetical protein
MVEERRALAPATAPLRAAETLDDELTQRRARAKKKRNEDKNS